MHVRNSLLLPFTVPLIFSSCAAAVVFEDQGVGDGSSELWSGAGRHTVEYIAADREPWRGCEFGLEIREQGPDPLSNGTPVAILPNERVLPKATIRGRLTSPALAPGDYFLLYTGDLNCEWEIRVYALAAP